MKPIHTIFVRLELSVEDGADEFQLAESIMEYLMADEINGLPESLFSIDGCEVMQP